MAVKTPIRGVFDGSTATGLAEFQSGDFIALTHGGLGASLMAQRVEYYYHN